MKPHNDTYAPRDKQQPTSTLLPRQETQEEHLDTRHHAPPKPRGQPSPRGRAERSEIIHQASTFVLPMAPLLPLPTFFDLPRIGVQLGGKQLTYPNQV